LVVDCCLAFSNLFRLHNYQTIELNNWIRTNVIIRAMPTIVALDIESTGVDSEKDAILEIGAVRFDGRTYDTGSKLGFLVANVAFGLARPDVAEGLRAELKKMLE